MSNIKIGDGVRFTGWSQELEIPEGVTDLRVGQIGLVFSTENVTSVSGDKGVGVIFVNTGVELFVLQLNEFEKV